MRPHFAAFLALSLLTGCVMRPDRRAVLNPLIGHPEADAVRVLGVPNRSLDTDGRRFLAYVDSWGAPYGAYGYDTSPDFYVWTCETTLEIVQGKVASYVLRGNACY